MNVELGHWLVTGFLLVWGTAYAGLVIFSFLLSSPEHWSKLVEDGRITAQYADYISLIPGWVVTLTYLAAFTRISGAISLALSSSLALPLFGASLVLVTVIMFRGFFIAGAASVIRPGQVVLEIVFLIISVGAVAYSCYAIQTGRLQ